MAERYRYWLQLMTRPEGTKPFGVVFECAYPTVAAIEAELRDFGCVSGHRLRLVDNGAGEKTVTAREEFGFGLASFASITRYFKTIHEERP